MVVAVAFIFDVDVHFTHPVNNRWWLWYDGNLHWLLTTKVDKVGFRQVSAKLCQIMLDYVRLCHTPDTWSRRKWRNWYFLLSHKSFSDNPRFPGKSDKPRFPDFVQADIRYHNRRQISTSTITRSTYNISLQSNLGIFVETLQKHLDGGANDIYVISVQTPQLEDWSFPLGHIQRARQGKAKQERTENICCRYLFNPSIMKESHISTYERIVFDHLLFIVLLIQFSSV